MGFNRRKMDDKRRRAAAIYSNWRITKPLLYR
jgi:hypothetical protein